MKVYKFRLYPTLEQCAVLYKQFDLCRYTYNKLLEELSKNKDRKHIQHYILKLKRNNPVLNEVYSKTLQYECYRLFSNLKGLSQLKKNGKKVGRLRFKGRDWFKTIVYNQSGFKLIERQQRFNILQLSKIGKIKLLQHRAVEGKIKGVIIKKKVGSWEAHIITDAVCDIQKGDNVIGIDLGVISFLTDNNGNKVGNPLYLKESLGLLKQKQHELSRKKRGSHNRYKARIQVAKLHEHVVQQRTDFLHKLTTQLVKQNSFIAVEKLNIKSMQNSAYNSRNINDSSWGRFLQLLDFKAESAGCQVVKVNPENTTKQCSHCGELQDMPLHIRQYDCLNCGMSMDRDKNSAINILKRALEQGTAEKDKVSSLKQEAITSTQGVRL